MTKRVFGRAPVWDFEENYKEELQSLNKGEGVTTAVREITKIIRH